MDPASALARHEAAGGCRSAPSPRSFWLDPAQLDQLNPTHRGDERYRYFALAKLVIKDFAHLSLDEIAQRITPCRFTHVTHYAHSYINCKNLS